MPNMRPGVDLAVMLVAGVTFIPVVLFGFGSFGWLLAPVVIVYVYAMTVAWTPYQRRISRFFHPRWYSHDPKMDPFHDSNWTVAGVAWGLFVVFLWPTVFVAMSLLKRL